MEFTAYLETSNDYEPAEVIAAFHLCLEYGQQAMSEKCNDRPVSIIKDIIDNNPTIERD